MNKVRTALYACAVTLSLSGCALLQGSKADTPIETVAEANAVLRSLAVELRTASKFNRITVEQAESLQGKLEYAYGLIVLAEGAAAAGDPAEADYYLNIISALLLDVEKDLSNG